LVTTTHTIGSTGDYANLGAWESARQTASSSGDTERAELESELHTGQVTLSGWTSGVLIEIGAEDAQDGDWAAGARYTVSGIMIKVSVNNNLTVSDIVFNGPGIGGLFDRPIWGEGNVQTDMHAARCMFRDINGYASAAIGTESDYPSGRQTITAENCVFSDVRAAVNPNSWAAYVDVLCDVTMAGCTLYDSSILAVLASPLSDLVLIATGCLMEGHGSYESLTFGATTGTRASTSTYNIVGESSTAHNATWDTVTGLSASATWVTGTPGSGEVGFTNIGTEDFSLVDHANNIAIDFVASGTMPTTDILGATRGATEDAGAFEVVSAGVDATGAAVGLLGVGAAVGTQTTTATGAGVGLLGTGSATATQSINATGSAVGLLGVGAASATQSIDATGTAVGLLGAASASVSQSTDAVGTAVGLLGVGAASVAQSIDASAAAVGLLGVGSAALAQEITSQGTALGLLGVGAATLGQGTEFTSAALGLLGVGVAAVSQQIGFTGVSVGALGVGYALLTQVVGPVVTVGAWSPEVSFAAGDEWLLVLDGPSADAPAARVEVVFRLD
jgi:hypothetical protein